MNFMLKDMFHNDYDVEVLKLLFLIKYVKEIKNNSFKTYLHY